MEYEEIVAPVAKPKKKVHGFSAPKEELTAEVEVETLAVPEEITVPAVKHHVELVRPLTPKKAVPRRGVKGASTTRS